MHEYKKRILNLIRSKKEELLWVLSCAGVAIPIL
jgi:hypothetical protein